MRFVLVLCVFASGCSVLDNIDFDAPPHIDPTRIYIANQSIVVRRSQEVSRYVCLSGPLECHGAGAQLFCSCY